MTTIATDGQTMAADGLLVCGGLILSRTAVKIARKRHVVLALTGPAGAMEALADWAECGCPPEGVPEIGEDWTVLMAREAGKVAIAVKDAPFPCAVDLPIAIGSGRAEAMAAMMAGASPRRAVEIAARLDTSTGGLITVVDIAEALGVAAQPPRRQPQAAE